ncbi:MAG: glycosyl hydrolase family 65 protein [Anaerolineales bacterium]
MQYGYFDSEHREYVITDPHTPVKWINYIGTLSFGGFVDHTGGALICKNDPTYNRITKYIQQMPASEFKGETLYLRIHQGRDRIVFSPFYVPTLDAFDRYECHVGLGYTRIISEFYGLRTDVTIFVPMGESREVRDIRITNISNRPQEVDAIPVVEYTHPNALQQFTNADWVPQTMQSRAISEPSGLKVLLQYPFMFRDLKVNYFTSNRPASSFETVRARFLGNHEYGTWANPLSLRQPELSNTEALRGDNIAALLHHLGKIRPGETVRLITQLGQEANLEAARPGIEKFRRPESVDAALAELSAFWDAYLTALQVETPDRLMNIMLNVHNPHQCYMTKTWSRYLSYYQLGLGSRGIGIRDSSQDVMAVLASIPDEGRAFIRLLLSMQRRDGSAYHQFNPLTLEASEGDSLERDDRPHYYSDDHLWLVLATTAYLKETGDFAFLREKVPFYDKDRKGRPLESAPVLEHLERALAFTRQDVGQHGLPLLGFADWNDTVNLPPGAESLFTANLYGKALLEMIALLQHLGESQQIAEYLNAYNEMHTRVEQLAWDGEWYVRYFDHTGKPLGSRRNAHGQIYVNGQSWPVISGFASRARGEKAMDSVYQRLNTRFGIKLSAPGYNGFDGKIGGISTYPPGAKENGGIFLHANPWAIIAETILGRGDRAYQYYAQINPAAKNEIIEVYECEPYVYPQNILGDEHPQFGLARNSWLSGTASWAYQAATQWILGVRPDYGGLRIDPCIPADWDGFKMVRRFRGHVYSIEVHNPKHVCQGVAQIIVDGSKIRGEVVPVELRGFQHKVEVWLGK